MKRAFRPLVSGLESRLVLAASGATAAVHAAASKPAAAAPAPPVVPPSMATATVDHLYRDTLGRAPDGLAISSLVPAVEAGTTTAAQLTTQLVGSAEFINNAISATASGPANAASYVSSLYVTVLGRSPSAAELGPWVNAIGSQSASLAQVAAAVVGSPEAATSTASILVRNSTANLASNALTNLYQDVLGRNPDALAVNSAVPAMQAGLTMAELATQVVSSPEFIGSVISPTGSGVANASSYVSALYATALGRSASPAELAAWVNAIGSQTASLAQVAATIVNSPEAAASPRGILARNQI